MFYKTTLIAAATFAVMSIAATAQAATSPSDDTVTLKVSLNGVNLSTKEGAKIAIARIHNAAEGICGSKPDNREIRAMGDYKACMKRTVDGAVASLDAPMVTALNSGSATTVEVASGNR